MPLGQVVSLVLITRLTILKSSKPIIPWRPPEKNPNFTKPVFDVVIHPPFIFFVNLHAKSLSHFVLPLPIPGIC